MDVDMCDNFFAVSLTLWVIDVRVMYLHTLLTCYIADIMCVGCVIYIVLITLCFDNLITSGVDKPIDYGLFR